jgi:hypothetical protein
VLLLLPPPPLMLPPPPLLLLEANGFHFRYKIATIIRNRSTGIVSRQRVAR